MGGWRGKKKSQMNWVLKEKQPYIVSCPYGIEQQLPEEREKIEGHFPQLKDSCNSRVLGERLDVRGRCGEK